MENIPINQCKVTVTVNRCERYTSAISVSLLYIGLILLPWIAEVVVATQISFENTIYMLLACGIAQATIAIYGAIRAGNVIICCKDAEEYDKNERKKCREFWCQNCIDCKSIFSGGFIIYFLPQWVLANAIISWVLINNKVVIPFYVHLSIYSPLVSYVMFMFVGYAIRCTSETDEYTPV